MGNTTQCCSCNCNCCSSGFCMKTIISRTDVSLPLKNFDLLDCYELYSE
uniref:Metallothionein n=1 Tax=Anguilla anguilla TaxID=7936 RepID=A0A0E9SR88_ANGAN